MILTALGNRCPLHTFNFHVHRMTKTVRPKRDKLNMKMVYHCILQVHSIFGKISSCLVAAPTSFICCKARLVTTVLSLHNMSITKVLTNSEIIAAVNRKTSEIPDFLFNRIDFLLDHKLSPVQLTWLHPVYGKMFS